jgi:ribosomal protein S18 acetylase RimI-like enzyme
MQRATIRVRPASPADAAFVLGLAPRFAETRAPWRTEDEVVTGTVSALGRALAAPRDDEAVFVAEDGGGAPLGFVYVTGATDFFTSEAVAHVSEIAVARDGTGAGTALMRAAEAWALARGARYVSLHVNARNGGARAFYETLGYDLEWQRLNKRLR